MSDEEKYCVYWAILGDYYYVCPEKMTLDDCCFEGTSDECYAWIEKREKEALEKLKNANSVRIYEEE